MDWLKKQPWFIYLFPAFAYLVGVKDYAAHTNTAQLIIQVLIFTAVTLLLYSLVRKISKRSIRYVLLLFYSLLSYTFFGNIKLLLAKSAPQVARYPVLIALLIAILILLFLILKNKKIAQSVFSYCNVLVVALLFFQLVQFIYAKATYSNQIIKPNTIKEFTSRPNIYFVLFDGYPGFESLDSLFGYNNRGHIKTLEQKGFHVQDSIRSNYNYTLAAMTSLFNMSYVQQKHSMPVSDFSFMYKAREAINSSALANALTKENYDINNFSIFPFANKKGAADYVNYLTPLQIANKYFFHNHVFNDLTKSKKFKNTPLLSKYAKRLDKYYYQNKKIFEDCIESINPNKPTFTYAHLLLPHEPYLTDSAGRLWKDLSTLPEKEAFVEYTKYANKLMLELADKIYKKDSNSIILFLSDHGYRGLTGEDKKYSYHNFMAIKTPDDQYTNIDKVKSNIQVFPYILNQYCGLNIEYKKDSTYYIYYTKNVFETIK